MAWNCIAHFPDGQMFFQFYWSVSELNWGEQLGNEGMTHRLPVQWISRQLTLPDNPRSVHFNISESNFSSIQKHDKLVTFLSFLRKIEITWANTGSKWKIQHRIYDKTRELSVSKSRRDKTPQNIGNFRGKYSLIVCPGVDSFLAISLISFDKALSRALCP